MFYNYYTLKANLEIRKIERQLSRLYTHREHYFAQHRRNEDIASIMYNPAWLLPEITRLEGQIECLKQQPISALYG